jgi:archaeosine synthase beta-subunit
MGLSDNSNEELRSDFAQRFNLVDVDLTAEVMSLRTPQDRIVATKVHSLIEVERIGRDQVTTQTVFLTGRECPLACTMCDLWKHTLTMPTAVGSIPQQIQDAIEGKANTQWLKLYNASNFFDPLAIPPDDYAAIAFLSNRYERVVVENHPKFDNRLIKQFQDLLACKLEIAIGLESTDDDVLRLLNKRFTSQQVEFIVRAWINRGIDIRAFVLIKPPASTPHQWFESTMKTVESAFKWGVRHVSLIPTRADWGLLKMWQSYGLYDPPSLDDIKRVARSLNEFDRDYQSISIDVWDWSQIRSDDQTALEILRQQVSHANENGWQTFKGKQ